MNRTPSFVTLVVFAFVGLAVSIISCGESPRTVDAAPALNQNPKTAERLIERAIERWELVVAAGEDESKWIDAYEFELPEVRRRETLALFLEGKHKFVYDSNTEPRVLLIEGDDAYLQVDCTWLAYRHPVIGKENPGLTQLMEMLEVWRWRGDDWYHEGPQRERSQFLTENPDVSEKVDAYLTGK